MLEEVQYTHCSTIPGLTLSSAQFANFRFEPHYHLEYHIGLVQSGVQRQSFHGETLFLGRGTVMLMPPGEVHDGTAASADPYTLRTFRLSPSLLQGLGEEITGSSAFPSQSAIILQDSPLAEHLLDLHTALQHPASDGIADETSALELLESLFARLKLPSQRHLSGTLTGEQIQKVRDYAEAYAADKIVLEDLSRLLDLDRFRFLKLFKRTVGMTPHAWLLRLRLEKSVTLMRKDRHRPITEIAHAVGFFDQSHFTRAFRDAYGITPARF